MNRQQVFNQVLCHMRVQRKVSSCNFGPLCLYRGPNGLRCAIGALIPDALYHPIIEGVGVSALMTRTGRHLQSILKSALGDLDCDDRKLLEDMQNAHDCSLKNGGMESFECCMRVIAEKYSLIYTPPLGDMDIAALLQGAEYAEKKKQWTEASEAMTDGTMTMTTKSERGCVDEIAITSS